MKQEDEHRFRCQAGECQKLFKGEIFWRKHFKTRHPKEAESLETGSSQDSDRCGGMIPCIRMEEPPANKSEPFDIVVYGNLNLPEKTRLVHDKDSSGTTVSEMEHIPTTVQPQPDGSSEVNSPPIPGQDCTQIYSVEYKRACSRIAMQAYREWTCSVFLACSKVTNS